MLPSFWLPTLYLPDLPKWINEFRSNGFVGLLGYQNFAQLQHIYGRELSRTLFAACGTKVFFNPKDRETAQEFSGYLGDREVKFYTRSRSYGSHGGSTRTEQYQRMPLLTADQILKLDQGECVFINPAYRGGGEASVPMKLKVQVPPPDVRIQQRRIDLWTEQVRDRLIERANKQLTITDLNQANELRCDVAEKMFPLPSLQDTHRSGEFEDLNFDISEDEFDEAFG